MHRGKSPSPDFLLEVQTVEVKRAYTSSALLSSLSSALQGPANLSFEHLNPQGSPPFSLAKQRSHFPTKTSTDLARSSPFRSAFRRPGASFREPCPCKCTSQMNFRSLQSLHVDFTQDTEWMTPATSSWTLCPRLLLLAFFCQSLLLANADEDSPKPLWKDISELHHPSVLT